MSELADETDSKSVVRNGVWVRFPPPAPKREISFPKGVSLFLLGNRTLRGQRAFEKRLIIVFSEVGAQTGTARLRAVVKQARRAATVSHHRHQKEKCLFKGCFSFFDYYKRFIYFITALPCARLFFMSKS